MHRDKNADPATAADFMKDWEAEYRQQLDAEAARATLEQKMTATIHAIGITPFGA